MQISNFEYLMELNTLAGRSYNDITQVDHALLARVDFHRKYEKESICVAHFHPLLNALQVLYYLVRVEPFTTLSIQLQGGKFDHADRMFSDISGTWDGVLEDMSDVKELVIYLYSVKLPPWADSPVDFIHKHHMALESEHVSSHLHEWIDLIFGWYFRYKQRGNEAVEANNVFFYITYEGTIDIDKIENPVSVIEVSGAPRSSTLSFPRQTLPAHSFCSFSQTIYRNPNGIRPYVIPNPDRCNIPADAIFASPDSVVVVDTNAPAAHVALHKWQPNTPDGHGTPFLFQHGKAAASSTGGALMRMFKGPGPSGTDDWQYPRASAFPASGVQSSAIVAITSDKEIITGGYSLTFA
ncbi:hypothetical protein B296_00015011 [Ensete ventricosum]|uniref:BEACH domain-containing protein n=1 Tax=Ensete ventricosum TaxID=4639 RepID=A0A427B732_ENSVE|nr:hypothetical protein B296_00015011 [Ensete ventricosum]